MTTRRRLSERIEVALALALLAGCSGSEGGEPPPSLSLSRSIVEIDASTVAAGSSTEARLALRDDAGNAYVSSGRSVAFTLSGGTSSGSFGAVVDNMDGTYTASFTGTTAGTATAVSATIDGAALTSLAPTVTVQAGPVSAITSTVTASPETVAAGSVSTLTLAARDAYGNPLGSGGLTVAFGTAGGTSAGTLGSVTDNGDGTYSAVFSGTTAGTPTTVTATIGGVDVASTLPALTVEPGPISAAYSLLSVGSTTLVSGTTTTATLTAWDAYGNRITSGGSTVVFSLSPGATTGTFDPTVDHGDGTYTAVLTAVGAGPFVALGATIDGANVTTTPPFVKVIPGPFWPATSTVASQWSTVKVGMSVPVVFTARDANGNRLASGGLTVDFALDGGTCSGTFGATVDGNDGTYTAQFTGTAVGTAGTLSATVGSDTVPGEQLAVVPAVVNLQVVVPMIELPLGNQAGTDADYWASQSALDPADYDGTVVYEVEVQADNRDTVARTVTLVDSAGKSLATLSVPAQTWARRVRQAFTPNGARDVYHLRIEGMQYANQLTLAAARLLVTQTGATRTKLFYPMATWNTATGVTYGGPLQALASTNQSCCGLPAPFVSVGFKKVAGAYSRLAASNPWTLEAVLATTGAPAQLALVQTSMGWEVGGGSLRVGSSASPDHPQLVSLSFPDDATRFTTGETVEPRFGLQTTGGGTNAYLYRAGLWVKLDPIETGEVCYPVSYERAFAQSSYFGALSGSRPFVDQALFTNPVTSYQVEAGIEWYSYLTVILRDCGTASDGSSCTDVVGGRLDAFPTYPSSERSSPTYGIRRTGPLDLPIGHHYQAYVSTNYSSFRSDCVWVTFH